LYKIPWEKILTHLEISLLGPPQIELDGTAIEVDTRKAIALLAYLAMESGPKQRESLATLLWPESEPSRGRAALRRTLSALNKALEGNWLDIERESIDLLHSDGLTLDVEQFEGFLASLADHGHPSSQVCRQCSQPLSEAIALYRGDFLSGFTLRDSKNFDDWQFFQTETLRRELERALDRVILVHTQTGELDEAIDSGRRRLALDPLHEATHRSLMRLYAWSGQRSTALRQYRECVKVLDQELKVPPLEETTALYEMIRKDRLAPPSSVGPAPRVEASLEAKPGKGPTDIKLPLVGRTAEWSNLEKAFQSSFQRGSLRLLEGEAGIGKTRLAEEFIATLRSQGAVVLSSACYEGESKLAFGPIVEALQSGLTLSGKDSWLEDVPRHLLIEASRLLPVLREFDSSLAEPTPLDSPGAQARFFEGIRQVILALTKGELPGVLFLDDLHYADEATLDLLTFIVRRSSEDPLLVLGCFRMEELPSDHRIRLLAAEGQWDGASSVISLRRLESGETSELLKSSGLSGEVVPDEIGDRLYKETEGIPYFISEYMTMIKGAVEGGGEIDWSVPESARSLLRTKLSNVSSGAMQLLTAGAILGRPFDFEMIREVSGRDEEEAVEMLEELLARKLIHESVVPESDGAATYLFQHEKLRSLVYDDTSHARRRLLHRRAAEALCRRDGAALAGQVAYHYQLAGLEAEAAEQFERAGEYARTLYANREALGHFAIALELGHPRPAVLLENMGDLNTLLGEYRHAIENLESAVAYGEEADRFRYERKLGLVHHRRGDWRLAERHFEASLVAMPGEGHVEDRALLFSDWALSAYKGGDLERAGDLARQALDLAIEKGNAHSVAQSHNIIGILARHRGDLDNAEEHLQTGLEIAGEMEDEAVLAAGLNNLALVLADKGEFERGLQATQRALDISVARGDRHREAALHNNLADLLQASGRTEEAISHVKRSVAIYAEIGVEADEYQPEVWKLVEW
jgi:DNA-binding SARP family transcriptional activator/Tfp pilus assembly protein PilF